MTETTETTEDCDRRLPPPCTECDGSGEWELTVTCLACDGYGCEPNDETPSLEELNASLVHVSDVVHRVLWHLRRRIDEEATS